jgi:8-oxo-dGTP pyrophosphatase MutT (NUDIX family)
VKETRSVIIAATDDERSVTVREKTKREPNWTKWPGGGLKDGESPEEGALRELWEETGIDREEILEIQIVYEEVRQTMRGPHRKYFCIAKISPRTVSRYRTVMMHYSPEGERSEVAARRNQDLMHMPDWHVDQRGEMLETYLAHVGAAV